MNIKKKILKILGNKDLEGTMQEIADEIGYTTRTTDEALRQLKDSGQVKRSKEIVYKITKV